MKNKILLFFILILLSVSIAFSQEPCPTIDNEHWTDAENLTFFENPVLMGMIVWSNVNERHYTYPDGSIDVKVDWSSLVNEPNPYGLTDNEMKGFLYMAIIKDLMRGHPYPDIVNISFYEVSECKLNHPCYVKAEQTSAFYCKDNLWPGPDPTPIMDNGVKYWVILNTMSCGFKCCKTTYQVQGNEDPNFLGPTILNTSQSVYYDCPASTETDCYFNTPLNCNSDCPLIQDLK